MRDPGWLDREFKAVSEDIKSWPAWMRREAGLEVVMYFFYRKSEKDLVNRTLPVLSGLRAAYMASQWANPQRIIEPLLIKDATGTVIKSEAGDIIKNEGGLASDYDYLFIANPPAGIESAQQIILELDAAGEPVRIAEWHRAVEQTGPMQITVSNGSYANGGRLNLPIADRQINITADPLYDTAVEISIIRSPTTGTVDVWYRENNGAIPAGYELIQTLLKVTIPAGATDLNALGLI